jgi:NADPH-dependent glutamate synthase beta subunit-like oxidoreductase
MTQTVTQIGECFFNEFHDIEWIPAPCQEACPVGTDIPSYIGLIWKEKYEEAFEAITATNPFASVCGRVCAKPCETICRRAESDGPVAIRNLKRFVMDRLGHDFRFTPVKVTKPQTIGIIGGGPTGLTAAQDLAEAGYEVHVYEKTGRPGGMMYAIPEFRLPRGIIEDDINRMLEHYPGIKIHLNSALGSQINMEELKKRHDAVLIAIGLWRDRNLGVPGEKEVIEGIYGINLLTEISNESNITLEGKAIVVGGGNVAMDMARTALRLGAEDVQLFCLESRDEMPAWEHEILHSEKEGVVINPSWGPKQILHKDGMVTGVEFMRCMSVFDSEGSFSPVYDPQKTMTVDAESVLLSIGLKAENEELDGLGMMSRGYVKADFDSMRTADPKVFAAGDCAFGPSAIVYAMSHGHRAAYYINNFLEGIEKPIPYSISYRTRRVEVAQDPLWEKLPLEEQVFHSRGKRGHNFSECESTYNPETAKRQAARCLRCDAETGSSDYQRRTREHLHAMARTEQGNIELLRHIALERLRPRDNPFPADRPARIDDIVFLSAALTRLVIDPYREECSTQTIIGGSINLKQPFFFTGFNDAPEEVRKALALGLIARGCCYVGPMPLFTGPLAETGTVPHDRLKWLQLIVPGGHDPQADADGLIYVLGNEFHPVSTERLHERQLLGLSVAAPALEKAIPWALEQGLDLLLLDGSAGVEKPWSELKGYPDLMVMRDAIHILRKKLNREEDIALVYFGGIRSGTDIAKILAMNCNAGMFCVATAIALGGIIEGDHMTFNSDRTFDERIEAVKNWIEATAEETAIIARCTGKTNVHNLEPEDMRSITLSTSEAMNIPMASGTKIREGF